MKGPLKIDVPKKGRVAKEQPPLPLPSNAQQAKAKASGKLVGIKVIRADGSIEEIR